MQQGATYTYCQRVNGSDAQISKQTNRMPHLPSTHSVLQRKSMISAWYCNALVIGLDFKVNQQTRSK